MLDAFLLVDIHFFREMLVGSFFAKTERHFSLMNIRLSQKLATKVKVKSPGSLPLHQNPLADWSAHLFVADRTQYILLTNTKSLYSTVCYGKGITSDGMFIQRALESIREFMNDDGFAAAYQQLIVPECGGVRFAKALNRQVIGSMNDMIGHAAMWMIERELSPHDVGFKLNEIPFSCLTGPEGRGYANPREVFRLLMTPSD
jgi:hypothetical protein